MDREAIFWKYNGNCAYCGCPILPSTKVLDKPAKRTQGMNFVRNSSRGNRDIADFCDASAAYINHGVTGKQVLNSQHSKIFFFFYLHYCN